MLTSIIDEVVTRLRTIGNGDAKWANTRAPTVLRVGEALRSTGATPIPYIVVGLSGGRYVEEGNTRVARDETVFIAVTTNPGADAIDDALNRWLHDIELVFGEDPSLGGSCAWFFPRDHAREYHEQGGSLYMDYALMLSTDLSDPSTTD